jgi:hypothetical protein
MMLSKRLHKGEGLQASKTKKAMVLVLILSLGCSAIMPVHALRSNSWRHPTKSSSNKARITGVGTATATAASGNEKKTSRAPGTAGNKKKESSKKRTIVWDYVN